MVRRRTKWTGLALALALCGGLAAPVAAASWYEQSNRGTAGERGNRHESVQRQDRDQQRQRQQQQQIHQQHQRQAAQPQTQPQTMRERYRQQSAQQERQRQQQNGQQRQREQQHRARQQQQEQQQRAMRELQRRQQSAQQRQHEQQQQQALRERQHRQIAQQEHQQEWQQRQREQQQALRERQRQQRASLDRERQRYRGNDDRRGYVWNNNRDDNNRYDHRDSRSDHYRQTTYRRPYKPVYNDRPWYGYHGKHHPRGRGPVVVYRNVHHIVTIPQPVYVEHLVGYNDYYYSGPYAGYDSVYRYDDGYGYRRSACNSDAVGAVIGAVLGGVIGADQGRGAGPVVGGALIGAVLGGVLGSAIDASDQACVGDVLEYVPSNQPVYWEAPSSGYGYEVTPMRTYEPHPGQYCREYQTVVTIGGRAEQAYGTACRQPDGAWKTVNS